MASHAAPHDGGRQPVPTRPLVSIGSGGANPAAIGDDIARMMAVQAEGLHGPTWNKWAGELHRFGRNTVLAYARDGTLLARVAGVGVTISASLRRVHHSERDQAFRDLADEAAIDALSYWQRIVMPERRWEPRSQVSTFFIRTCLMRAPRAAARVAVDEPLTDADLVVHDLRRASLDEPGRLTLGRQELARVSTQIDELPADERRLLLRAAIDGVPQLDLAAEFGTTVRGIEGRLHRIRAKLRAA